MSFKGELLDFERTSSEYGPKLEFTVKGDTKSFEKRIDRCKWRNETHHRNIYGNRWEVDRTPSALNAIERETGIDIDREVLVDYSETVALKLDSGSMFIEMVEMPEGVLSILEEELSYESTYWDNKANKKRTYKKNVIFDEGIPIGLKHQVKGILDEIGIPYSFPDYRNRPSMWNVDYEWNFPHELRDYQKKGLSRMMQGSCVIQWPTGAGKTVGALKTVHEMGLSTLILVHQKDLLEQWCREIREILGVEPGVVQGSREEYRNITVAMIPSLHNRIEERSNSYKIDDFDMLITDECHHLQADTWLDVALKTDAYYRYGLSATVGESMQSSDGHMLKIVAGIGPNDLKVSPEYLIEEGYLAKPEFEWLYPSKKSGNFKNWQEAYEECIVKNTDRNEVIVEKGEYLLGNERRLLVDVKRIEHGERILSLFENGLVRKEWDPNKEPEEELPFDVTFRKEECAEWPIPIVHNGEETVGYAVNGDMIRAIEMSLENTEVSVMWVSGKDSSETREYILEKFRKGEVDCLVSTLLREGVNVPELDAVILAGGGKSAIQLIQTIGRCLRPEGSDNALIIDLKDMGDYVTNHTKERYNAMKDYYGKYCDTTPVGLF